ncbi:MAG: imidazolonepropionase [Planctomycetes bacterium]|nr:imidazolonepropionase [Planctomycetota bacterium]
MEACDLLIRNASEVVTLAGAAPRVRAALDRPEVVVQGAVAVAGGKIVAVGSAAQVEARFRPAAVLDAQGGAIVPGFVDAHTHPVFGATREAEFDMRLRGRTYQEISAAGGGIFSSVRSLRAASSAELARLVHARFDRFLTAGTTTIEAKSGYGLNREDEIRSLEILRDAAAEHPLEVVPTFLGAHQVPEEYSAARSEYLDFVIQRVLPEVRARRLAVACDVFCDQGAYTVAESRRLLDAARRQGFALRVHADELAPVGAAELAAELCAASADHLCRVSDAGIAALCAAGTTAVLLPGTVLSLGAKALPPARRLIDEGAIVAIASDFNPGTSYLLSMPCVIAIACTLLRMTVAEALAAATINAAWSLGIADRIGSIEEGKQADLLLLEHPSHLFLAYQLGENPVAAVVKRGRVVYERPALEIRR